MATISLHNPSNFSSTIPIFPMGAQAITPSDTDKFPRPVAVWVGTGGDVTVLPANGGAQLTFPAVQAGSCVPCMVLAVLATGTTAADLKALY